MRGKYVLVRNYAICTDIGFESFYEIYQERAEVFFNQNITSERRALIEMIHCILVTAGL